MKKRLAFILTISLLAGMAGACGSEDKEVSVSASSGETGNSVSGEVSSSSGFESTGDATQDAILSAPIAEGDSVKTEDCIRLGNYKGLSLTKTVEPVSDDDVVSEIKSSMSPEEVDDPDAAAEEGDTVNIAYTGKIDGKEFDGGSSDSYDLVLGSGTFIDGFEDGVIGMKKGETKDLNLTFPENYTEELAGKDVVFTVTVNAIKRTPELTDAWVKENTNGQFDSLEDYEASVREELEEQNEESAEQAMQGDAWNQVEENSTFLQLPESYVEEGEKQYEENVTNAAEQYGLSLDDYITQSGLTAEEYNRYKEQSGRFTAASRLMLDALVDAEGITADSKEYTDELQKVAELYGMTSDELIEQNGEDTVNDYVLTQIAVDHIISYADVTETVSSSS